MAWAKQVTTSAATYPSKSEMDLSFVLGVLVGSSDD
jgi:hypothetical protein